MTERIASDLSAGRCIACDLSAGRRPLPGGRIHRTEHWIVEHTVGPLGLGTLIVKPERHVTAVADLGDDEAGELGPLLRTAAAVARSVVPRVEQVYVCLWSHAERVPGHIHYVVQPVTTDDLRAFDAHGPALQVAMFERDETPSVADVERVADDARRLFSAS